MRYSYGLKMKIFLVGMYNNLLCRFYFYDYFSIYFLRFNISSLWRDRGNVKAANEIDNTWRYCMGGYNNDIYR